MLIIERPTITNLTTGGQNQPPIPEPEILPMPKPTDIREYTDIRFLEWNLRQSRESP